MSKGSTTSGRGEKGSAEKKRSKAANTDAPDILKKARMVKPKNGKGAKSDGAKSTVKKAKRSQIKRPPIKPAKAAEDESPKVKNSGMSWAITFDDEPEPETDKQNKEARKDSEKPEYCVDKKAADKPERVKKDKKVNMKDRRRSSSHGVDNPGSVVKQSERGQPSTTTRRPSSDGVGKKISINNTKAADLQVGKENLSSTKTIDNDKISPSKARQLSRPLSAKLDDSKSLKSKELTKTSQAFIADFDSTTIKSKGITVRPSSAGFTGKASLDLDKPISFKSKTEPPSIRQTEAKKSAAKARENGNQESDSGYQSPTTTNPSLSVDTRENADTVTEHSESNGITSKPTSSNHIRETDKSVKSNTELEKISSKDVEFSSLEEFPATTKNLLHGKLENLPSLPRTSVRVFLSSTFSGEII